MSGKLEGTNSKVVNISGLLWEMLLSQHLKKSVPIWTVRNARNRGQELVPQCKGALHLTFGDNHEWDGLRNLTAEAWATPNHEAKLSVVGRERALD